jgi:hypothetical protein
MDSLSLLQTLVDRETLATVFTEVSLQVIPFIVTDGMLDKILGIAKLA